MADCCSCKIQSACGSGEELKYSRNFYANALRLYLEGEITAEELADWNDCMERPPKDEDELLFYAWIAFHDLRSEDPDYRLTYMELANLYNCLSGKKNYTGFLSLV